MPGEIAIDLRVGGSYRIEMVRAGCDEPVAVTGEFLEIEPSRRLVYTWRWEGAFAGMPATVVTFELRPSENETVLTLRHDDFVHPGLRQQHRTGWLAACNRLDRLLTGPGNSREHPTVP